MVVSAHHDLKGYVFMQILPISLIIKTAAFVPRVNIGTIIHDQARAIRSPYG